MAALSRQYYYGSSRRWTNKSHEALTRFDGKLVLAFFPWLRHKSFSTSFSSNLKSQPGNNSLTKLPLKLLFLIVLCQTMQRLTSLEITKYHNLIKRTIFQIFVFSLFFLQPKFTSSLLWCLKVRGFSVAHFPRLVEQRLSLEDHHKSVSSAILFHSPFLGPFLTLRYIAVASIRSFVYVYQKSSFLSDYG